MPWHPPIPAGLATSPNIHSLQSRAAVVLLLYCYDSVGRDGRATINLKEAALAIEEPYETVRRWWRELRAGPFFCEQIDRGRIGWSVKFADDWIDWHVLSNNFQRSPMNVEENSIDVERPPMNGEEPSIGFSINFERPPMNVEGSAYKVLSISDQTRESEEQDRTSRALSPAVAAYYKAFPQVRLTKKQQAIITELVGDGVERLECWREVIQDYELTPNWKPENLGNMRSRFDAKLQHRQNGRGRNHAEPARPLIPIATSSIPTDANSRAETARKAREAHEARKKR